MLGLQPDDIGLLVSASDPRLSPDGSRVAFSVQRVDRERNRYQARVLVASADGATPAVALSPDDVSADLARRPRDTTSTVIRDCFMADAAQTVLEAGSTGSTRASTAGGWAESRPPRRRSGHPSCEHVFVS